MFVISRIIIRHTNRNACIAFPRPISRSHTTYNGKDYHKILGVSSTASIKEISQAYRRMAIKYHPDKTHYDSEKFKEITDAYNILINKMNNPIPDTDPSYTQSSVNNNQSSYTTYNSTSSGNQSNNKYYQHSYSSNNNSNPNIQNAGNPKQQLWLFGWMGVCAIIICYGILSYSKKKKELTQSLIKAYYYWNSSDIGYKLRNIINGESNPITIDLCFSAPDSYSWKSKELFDSYDTFEINNDTITCQVKDKKIYVTKYQYDNYIIEGTWYDNKFTGILKYKTRSRTIKNNIIIGDTRYSKYNIQSTSDDNYQFEKTKDNLTEKGTYNNKGQKIGRYEKIIESGGHHYHIIDVTYSTHDPELIKYGYTEKEIHLHEQHLPDGIDQNKLNEINNRITELTQKLANEQNRSISRPTHAMTSSELNAYNNQLKQQEDTIHKLKSQIDKEKQNIRLTKEQPIRTKREVERLAYCNDLMKHFNDAITTSRKLDARFFHCQPEITSLGHKIEKLFYSDTLNIE